MDSKVGDQTITTKGVSAIVAAYNEAARIQSVLDVLVQCPSIHEVVVVNDGSRDGTREVVQPYVERYNVAYVEHERNLGKGKAMNTGVAHAHHDVIFFADADTKGLTCEVIATTVAPVCNGQVDMFIAMRNRKSYYVRFILAFVPLLGGERALTKRLWQQLPDYYKQRFQIETGLNFFAKWYGKGYRFEVFHGITQTIKEKKYGWWYGFLQRVGMFRDVIAAIIRLQIREVPHIVKRRRFLWMNVIQSFGGMLIGSLISIAAMVGPQRFIKTVFAEQLAEDPNTPFLDMLLYFSSVISIQILLFVGGMLVALNLLYMMINVEQLLFGQSRHVTTRRRP